MKVRWTIFLFLGGMAFLATLGTGLAIIGFASDWRMMILGMVVQQTGAKVD